MDASVLENQLRQRLKRVSSRQDIPSNTPGSATQSLGSNPPSRPDSEEPPLTHPPSRTPSRLDLLGAKSNEVETSAATKRSDTSLDGGANDELPPLPPGAVKAALAALDTSKIDKEIWEILQLGDSTTSSGSATLKKTFLPEATPVDLVLPGPAKPFTEDDDQKEEEKKDTAGKDRDGFTSDEDDGFGSDDDQEWETEPVKCTIPEQHLKRFCSLVGSIRGWFAENKILLNNESKDIREELSSGVALCKFLASISNDKSILEGVQTDYSPALANLSEWKNLEYFFAQARRVYPKLADVVCGPKDIYNNADMANFLSFLFLLSRCAGKSLDTMNNDGKATKKDILLVKKQKPETIANALTIFDEDEHRKSSPVYSWLRDLKMDMYFLKFEDHGWDDLEKIALMDEKDLRALGVEKDGHVKFLLTRISELNYLKDVLLSSRADRALQLDDASSTVPSPAASSVASDDKPQSLYDQEFKQVLRKVSTTMRQFPGLDGLKDMYDVAAHLVVSSVTRPALVVDVSGTGQAVVGVAGALSPLFEIPMENIDLMEVLRRGIAKVNTLGIATSKRIFLVGITASRALYEDVLKLAPNGCFICNPKSAAVLALRSCGLSDGLALDLDASKVARVIAVNGCRAIPQGFVTEVIKAGSDEEDSAKREKILMGMVSSSLGECGFSQSSKRVNGGLVITGTRIALTAGIVKRFSAGLFNLGPVARWGAASQVASHPDFQHRWLKAAPVRPQEEMLFPLLLPSRRKELAAKACRAASHLERLSRMKEEAAKLDELNARNAASPHFTTFSSPPRAIRPIPGTAGSPLSPIAAAVASGTAPTAVPAIVARPTKPQPPLRPPPPMQKRPLEPFSSKAAVSEPVMKSTAPKASASGASANSSSPEKDGISATSANPAKGAVASATPKSVSTQTSTQGTTSVKPTSSNGATTDAAKVNLVDASTKTSVLSSTNSVLGGIAKLATPLSIKVLTPTAAKVGDSPPGASPLNKGTYIPIVDAHVEELKDHITQKDVIEKFKIFLLTDMAKNKGRIAKLSFSDVLKALPPDLRKLMRKAGFIFMDRNDDEEESVKEEDSDILMEML